MSKNSFLTLAGEWFLHSGIQEAVGGVARYYRSDLAANALVSTEITGYAVSALAYLHDRTGDERCRERALAAGRFLTRLAWDDALRLLPFEYPADRAFFFDMGIVARGLLALWRRTGDSEFLEGALHCAEAMARDFSAGCEFHPILVLPSKQPAARDGRWSRGPGCYQLKAALPWWELAEEAGHEEFRACYERVLAYSLAGHAGFPLGEPARERIMDRLHAYGYFLEGLLPVAGRRDCAAALTAGIAAMSAHLAEVAPLFERSDVYAQLLRARLFANALGVVPLDEAAAAREAEALAGFQAQVGGSRLQGGFYFGRKGGEFLPYLNPVSTAFCTQALEMWRQYRGGEPLPSWRDLI